ncbi:MAG: hypothetical protein Q4A56_06645 [Porphyromonadaceae bacterium]|nr:hypothetical protein [Porphyromonadaceae bacterium]
MKKSKYLLITLLTSVLVITSCGEQKSFSSALLIGKWKRPVVAPDGKQGFDCYRYDNGGIGATWDTSEDVSEGEAQAFRWVLSEDQLSITHLGQMGQEIPKRYTIKILNSTTLSYTDNYGTSFTFTKFTEQP